MSPDPDKPMRVLVTGGAGFIGSHVVGRLGMCGRPVTVFDVASAIEGVALGFTEAGFVEASVLDADALHEATRGTDAVVHLAGFVRSDMIRHPYEGASLQLQGTLNVLKACRANGVRHLGYASSFYVYDGRSPEEAVDESTLLDPLAMELFGSAKFMGEVLCHEYARRYGLGVSVFRIGPTYGGRGSSAVDEFVGAGLAGETIEIWGRGERRNQYTFVGDVADAIVAGLTRDGETYNVVSSEAVSLRDVAGMLKKCGIETRFDESRTEGPNLPYIRSDKAARELAWEPRPLTLGLEAVVRRLSCGDSDVPSGVIARS